MTQFQAVMFENAGKYDLPELMEQLVRIPVSMFLTLLALEYIPPYRVKYIFPSIPLTLRWKLSPLLTNSTSKLPRKKILPFCFVGSSQCNSISHLSFNLLFIVAERSERYYPAFPSAGSAAAGSAAAGSH